MKLPPRPNGSVDGLKALKQKLRGNGKNVNIKNQYII